MQSSTGPTQPNRLSPGYTAQPSTATSIRTTSQTSTSPADGHTQRLTLFQPECTKGRGSRCDFSDWLGKQEIHSKPLEDGKMWFGLVPSFKYNGFLDSAASAPNRDTILCHANHIDTNRRYGNQQLLGQDQLDHLSSILSEHQAKCTQDRTCWMDPSTFTTSGLSGDPLTFVARRASDRLSDEIGGIPRSGGHGSLSLELNTTRNKLHGAEMDLDKQSLRLLGFRWYHNQGFVRETTVSENRDKFASRATDVSQRLAHRIYLLDQVRQTLANGTGVYASSLANTVAERESIIDRGAGKCGGQAVRDLKAQE